MRKLTELIVLIRGGGEEGSAIAHRLFLSHIRICITETVSPLEVNRGTCFSEAVYDDAKTIEGVTAIRALPSLEQIYRVWREGHIPVLVDPDITAKYLLKPDVLVNAMMLKRQTSTRITDAPLVIGIGPGFTAGNDAHIIIETGGRYAGRVLFEGKSAEVPEESSRIDSLLDEKIIFAEEAGVITTDRKIGDPVEAGEIIGLLGDTPLKAPLSGIIRGILRNEAKVLANSKLAEIDPVNDRSVCFSFQDKMRAVSGGVLEAILHVVNAPDEA